MLAVTGSGTANATAHGDPVRNNPGQTMTVGSCNLQFLCQGKSPDTPANTPYEQLPYRPGVLTLQR